MHFICLDENGEAINMQISPEGSDSPHHHHTETSIREIRLSPPGHDNIPRTVLYTYTSGRDLPFFDLFDSCVN